MDVAHTYIAPTVGSDVTSNVLDEALNCLGMVINKRPGQAIILCTNSQIFRFDNTNMNRNIDPEWVQKIKMEIKEMRSNDQLMQVTAMIDVTDIASLFDAKKSGEVTPHFTAKVADGQHRIEAFRQLLQEDPNTLYEFYATIYIVKSALEEKNLFEKLNNRKEVTTTDRTDTETRLRFVTAWTELTSLHQTRMCVRNINNAKILRDPGVMLALSKMTNAQIKDKILRIGTEYTHEFEKQSAHTATFANSVVFKAVHNTKLFQLVTYSTDKTKSTDWILKICK